ncbi:hypothetical protein [Muricomes intestini]|uniref:Uncharacterized protein n=2 Tax=Muricomes intestini TaxID=1796634 RepID=A0A4R3KGK4_9FIRM|nr:hypothetical protein EDD59_102108 [Muricomes intestini]HAX53097.1 hypothetical protein [Lachnospiraceae bacterium]HCR83990.1 hypothetical protein [Lachnospiraceae bacterium]
MILQEEFKKSGYKDILVGDIASEYEINLEDIFDLEQKPEELLCIFISEQRDDLFFLLNGDLMEIDSLCDRWDDRIRVFMIINGKSEEIHKLKYNIVQLIVYSKEIPDKSREGNLLISRKILIKGDMTDKNQIVIDDDEVIELPFHMIPTDAFAPDVEQKKRLSQLLPEDENLLALMKKQQKRVNRKEKEGVLDKSFKVQDYEKIKEWLKR